MNSVRPPPPLLNLPNSSSSMKISSRSILSPGRAGAGAARDPPSISLSTSRSRKLRNSRSIKGGASPAMFLTTGKKRGSGFENPEPSSPKVTCIGQVRVKSKKKHAKNLRTLSRRRSTGDVSFRRLEHPVDGFGNYQQESLPLQRNNQRWVHLPLTICEALRAFGSEVSCLFPCRSSCSSTTGMEKEEKMIGGLAEEGNRQGSCGAVLARWLVALQEGDGGGRVAAGEREIELVAGDDDDDDNDENENENDDICIRNSRRHVFQDLEIVNDSILGSKDEARVSICVPPKNALLLMRCRSDPMKMEALTNRFWEPTMENNEEEEEEEESVDDKEKFEERKIPQEETLMALIEVSDQEHDDLEDAVNQEKFKKNLEMEMKQRVQEENVETNSEMEEKQSVEEEDNQEQSIEKTNEEEDNQEQSIETDKEDNQEQSIETNGEEESMFLWSLFDENADQDQEPEEEEEEHSEMLDAQEELWEDEIVQESEVKDLEEENKEMAMGFAEKVMESKEVENEVVEREDDKMLPECLLLMMYEPKLSMEVSKETWVCSKDFIRRHSGRKPPQAPPPVVKSMNGQDESKVQCQPVFQLQQPARSSCSSMAAMLEQKLANTNGYEPLVLKRCKSEPMRTASVKLAPETCFWKNKLDPPRRASFGIMG